MRGDRRPNLRDAVVDWLRDCENVTCCKDRGLFGAEAQVQHIAAVVGSLPDAKQIDSEGIRTPAGRAQWISSPSP